MPNKKNTRVLLNTALFLFISFCSLAQIPAGYYTDADGKTGYTLKTSLYNIIKDHNSQSYASLWSVYQTSDKKANGKVWDMYSDVPGGTPAYEYTFVTNQCGNYSGEGSCYNREHSFPKSWFNDASPMYTDPFHIVPTDGYVNGKRGNYAFGEVGSPSFTSTNGSKVGTSNYSGYSGIVFEPIDAYKGDFARGYFYMATRYENLIAGWETNNENGDAMLNGTSDQVYEDWALAMLIEWHNADPVSQKEIDRNNAIFNYQNNRNPFIDHPEYVDAIWGGTASPVMNVTESLIDFGSVAFGNVSDVQSYIVSGSNLTNNISITANNGFEISTTNSDQSFNSSLTLTPTSGTVANTTIFVRFNPLSNTNSNVNGTIIHTSSGATSNTINLSGAEQNDTNPALVNITASLVDFGSVAFGNVSDVQSYTLTGTDLTNDIDITTNNGFQISLINEDTEYTTNLTLSPTGGTIAATTIFVRLKPLTDSNSTVESSIIHTSTGAATQILAVSGSEYYKVIPEINFNFSLRNIDPVALYEIQLFASEAPNDDITIYIEQTGSAGLEYEVNYTTTPSLTNNVIELVWPAGEINAAFLVNFTLESINPLTPGNLTFSLNDSDDYFYGTNNNFELNLNAGEVINAVEERMDKVTIFPNPAKETVSVQWGAGVFDYTITDLKGKILIKGTFEKAKNIDVSGMKSGIYLLQLTNTENRITQRLSID